MDLVDIGSDRLDPDTNELRAQCKSAPIGDNEDDAPGHDNIAIFGSLGLTARCYHKTSDGHAQMLVDENVPGYNAVGVGRRDTRPASSKVVEELGEGETAVHSTGPDFDSRAFFKKQLAALMVGDDCALVMDRENKKFSITCFGLHFELSEENGFVVTEGASAIQLKGGAISLSGQIVLGGRNPIGFVQFSPNVTPVVGVTGQCAGAPGVFIGS